MCTNTWGHFHGCGHDAVAYVARCATALESGGEMCTPGQRDDAADWQDDEEGFCAVCKGETPPMTP